MSASGESDPRTGRPLKPVGSLTDEELERELTVAAAAPDRLRTDRYHELLRERAKRAGAQGRGRG